MAKTKMMNEIAALYRPLQDQQLALKQLTGSFFKAVTVNKMANAKTNMDSFAKVYKKYATGIDAMTKKVSALEAYMNKWDSDKHWKNKFKSSKKMQKSKDIVTRSVKNNRELLQDLYQERDTLKSFLDGSSVYL